MKPAACALVLVLAWGASVAAEEAQEHAHGPRHGGFFGDADDVYHYEVLLEPGNHLMLYVNDELNRPMDVRGLEGRWILNPDDPEPSTGVFVPSADGVYLLATLPSTQTAPVHIKVAVLKNGMWVEMEFFLPAPQPAD